jgi:hypothetical protein
MLLEDRRTGDDAVELIGVAQRGHHRLSPAARAASVVGVLRRPSVVGADQRLGGLRHLPQ